MSPERPESPDEPSRDDPAAHDGATGYICPRCGGALWAHGDGGTARGYRCRVGHAFTPAELWDQHADMRNRAIAGTARLLAEHADLARALAAEARTRGRADLAAPLEAEASSNEHYAHHLLGMLGELGADVGAS